MKSVASWSARAAVVLLLCLLTGAVVLEGAQPQHTHAGSQPGLYNAECPLALASHVRTDGWTPSPPAVAALTITVTPGLSALPAKLPVRSLAARSSRAPPLA